jgi:DNA-binding transcriptional ArsR family regulator
MRPIPQNFLHYPLSTLLGTEASVRVLREFAHHGRELTTTQLATRTGVTDQSVRNVLRVLTKTHVIRTYGQGRAVSYQLDTDHPLGAMLRDLFRAEEDRLRALNDDIREAVTRVDPLPIALWIFGSGAHSEGIPGSDLELLLVGEDEDSARRGAVALRRELVSVEEKHRVTPAVVPVSSGNLLRLTRTEDAFQREILEDGTPLYGPWPETLLTHLQREETAAAQGNPSGSRSGMQADGGSERTGTGHSAPAGGLKRPAGTAETR